MAEEYRKQNEHRRIYSFEPDSSVSGKLHVPALVDPLGLGEQRVAKAGTLASATGPDVHTGRHNELSEAYLGFRDPRYPALLCGKLRGRDEEVPIPAQQAHDLCLGFANEDAVQREVAGRSLYPVALLVTTRAQRTIEQAVRFSDGQVRGRQELERSDSTTTQVTDIEPRKVSFLMQFQQRRRDQIQDRIIDASNQNCEAFKDDLRAFRADTGFLFSSGAVGLTAAGAILPGAAPILSGLGAATVGIGEAADASYFERQTISVLVKGIDAKRERLLKAAQEKRASDVVDYTVEAAVADARQYHNACTILSGLDEAEETLSDRLTSLTRSIQERLAPPEAQPTADNDDQAPTGDGAGGAGAGGAGAGGAGAGGAGVTPGGRNLLAPAPRLDGPSFGFPFRTRSLPAVPSGN